MPAYETVTVRGEGLRLDLIVWRRLKRPFKAVVERILDVNPGLAAKGPVLPIGTVVNIPVELLSPPPEPTRPVVKLWD